MNLQKKMSTFFLLMFLLLPFLVIGQRDKSVLSPEQCGKSVLYEEDLIATTVTGATKYGFRIFNNTGFDTYIESLTANVSTSGLGLSLYSNYKVTVKAEVDSVWESYSDTCDFHYTLNCGYDDYLNTEFIKNPAKKQAYLDTLNNINLRSKELTVVTPKIIPIVFHIIVPQGRSPYEYCHPDRVLQALKTMNEVYAGQRSNTGYGVNTQIKFCLATQTNSGTSLFFSAGGFDYIGMTYLVTGNSSQNINISTNLSTSITNFTNNFYSTNFPSDKYLNVFITEGSPLISSWNGVCVTFPNFKACYIRTSLIGINSYTLGYSLPHEAGHFLGLPHTWGPPESPGEDPCLIDDGFSDTEPHAGPITTCNTTTLNCNGGTALPIHNIMNYTPDGCRHSFTNEQKMFMHEYINSHINILTSDFTNCNLQPAIPWFISPVETHNCTGINRIRFNIESGTISNYKLMFSLNSGAFTDISNNNIFNTSNTTEYYTDFDFNLGNYILKITNTNGTIVYATKYITTITCETTIPTNEKDNSSWHFDQKASLDFSTGIGLLKETEIEATNAETSICDGSGNLVFYTNGQKIWNNQHQLSSFTLGGCVSCNKGVMLIPLTAANTYAAIFYEESGSVYKLRYQVITTSFTGTNSQIISVGNPIDIFTSNATYTNNASGLTLCPRLGVSNQYWLLTSLNANNSYKPTSILLTINSTTISNSTFQQFPLVTQTFPSAFPIVGAKLSTIKLSPNARYVVYATGDGANLFFFNSATGLFSKPTTNSSCNIPTTKCAQFAFSKDSRFLYNTDIATNYILKRIDLESVNWCSCGIANEIVVEKLAINDPTYAVAGAYLQEGPDQRIYITHRSDNSSYRKSISVIGSPTKVFNNPSNSFEQQLNYMEKYITYPNFQNWQSHVVSNDNYLPNYIDAKPECNVYYTYCGSNCSGNITVNNLSQIANPALYKWWLDGSQVTLTPTNQLTIPQGTHTLVLQNTGCPTNSTYSKTITIGVPTVAISGETNICNNDVYYTYYATASGASQPNYGNTNVWTITYGSTTVGIPSSLSLNPPSNNSIKFRISDLNLPVGITSFSLKVTTTTLTGCTASTSKVITIKSKPTISVIDACINNGSINFGGLTNPSTLGLTNMLNNTTNTVQTVNPSYIFSGLQPSNYQYTVTTNGCTYTGENAVNNIVSFPNYSFACNGGNYQLSFATSTGTITVLDGTTTISHIPSSFYIFNVIAGHQLTVTYSVSSCTHTELITVPSLGIYFSNVNPYYCSTNMGEAVFTTNLISLIEITVTLTNSTGNTTNPALNLQSGPNENYIVISGLNAGNYTLTFFKNGCSYPFTFTITAFLQTVPLQNVTISGTVTCTNTVYYVEGDVVINPGATLNINSCTLMFAPGKKIILYSGFGTTPGGKILISNSTLSNFNECNSSPWEGIYLAGIDNGSSLNKPVVSITGNSIIKNANCAINSQGGGAVQLNGTTFIDNAIGVKFENFTVFQTKALTFIKKCNFKYINLAIENIDSHVRLNNFKYRLPITGTSFVGSPITTTEANKNGKGCGVYSSGSDFRIGKEGGTSSIFIHLSCGVKAEATSATSTSLDQIIFKQCFHNVYFNGLISPTITNCRFSSSNMMQNNWLETSINPTWLYISSGIWLNSCQGYTITDNRFNSHTVGLYINSTLNPAIPCYVKNNEFRNCNIIPQASAIVCTGTNYYIDGGGIESGLELKCNDFIISNIFNIAVVNGTIKHEQGYNSSTDPTAPAGNTFVEGYNGVNPYGGCTGTEKNFHVEGNNDDYTYYYHGSDVYGNPSNLVVTNPNECITELNWKNPINNPYEKSTACGVTSGMNMMSTPSGLVNYTAMSNELDQKEANIMAAENELQELVDNGDTYRMLMNIEITPESGYDEIRREFCQTSPYTSDTVLLSFMNDEQQKFNSLFKAEVLMQNSPLPKKVKKDLDKADLTPLHRYIVEQYQQGQNLREQKERELGHLKKEKIERLMEFTYELVKNDSLEQNRQNLLQLLQEQNTQATDQMLWSFSVNYRNYGMAQQALTRMRNRLTGADQIYDSRINAAINMLQLITELDTTTNDSIKSIKVYAEETTINTLAEGNDEWAVKARYLKRVYLGDKSQETAYLPSLTGNNKSKINYKPVLAKLTDFLSEISIYPNPADKVLRINYAIPAKMNITVRIFNSIGQIVYNKSNLPNLGTLNLDVNNFNEGIYYIDFGNIAKQKFTVIH